MQEHDQGRENGESIELWLRTEVARSRLSFGDLVIWCMLSLKMISVAWSMSKVSLSEGRRRA